MHRYKIEPRESRSRRDSMFLTDSPHASSSRDLPASPMPDRRSTSKKSARWFVKGQGGGRADTEYAMKKQRTIDYVQEKFSRKECIRFIPKPPKKKGDPIKCHCGEEAEDHEKNIAGVTDFYQHGVDVMANNLDTGDSTKPWDAKHDIRTFRPTNAFGKINFVNEGLGGHKPAKYLRVVDNTDVVDVLDLMIKHWNMEKPFSPNLVITVIGGAKNFKLDGKKKETFNIGLVDVARTTHAWIITSGCNMGVMKATGEAVAEGQAYNWDEDGMSHTLRCIGIAPWGYVERKEELVSKDKQGCWNAQYRVNNIIRTGKPVSLNHNHTHFLLVDDGHRNRYDGVADFRARLEEKIFTPRSSESSRDLRNGGMGIPVVLVVVEGGTDAIEDVSKSLKRKVPVVICDCTGRAADILAYAYTHFSTAADGTRKIKSKTFESVIEEMLIKAYGKTWKERSSIEKEKARFLKIVLECCEDENLITVFDMSKNEDLDSAILSALLKGQAAKTTHQLRDQLKLALTWNRSDIAEEKIFNKDIQWEPGILDDIMTLALKDDKVQFVRLLLQNGMAMTDYLTVPKLTDLYNSAPPVSHLRMLLRTDKSSEKFCLSDVHKLLSKLMIKHDNNIYSDNVQPHKIQNMRPDARPHQGRFPHPFRELFLWAVLMNRMEMARFLWERADEAIPSALVASSIYESLANMVAHYDHDMKENYMQCKDEFEMLAVKVLEECHFTQPDKAAMLVERTYANWGNKSCLEIASQANDRVFLSTVCCQNSINSLWQQGVKSRKMVVLALFCPLLIFWLVRFEKLPSGEPPTAFQKLITFYRAPITKFAGNFMSYMLFLVLYSWVLLVDFQPMFTISEWVMTAWMATLLMEEVREMFFMSNGMSISERLKDYWHFSVFNRIDIVILIFAIVGFGLRMDKSLYIEAKTVYCVNAICLFMRLLSFYSASSYLGPKLVMISRMVQELIQYLVILVVFLLAYGVASQSLMYPVRNNPSHLILRDIIYYPYWQIYGELYLEELEGRTDECLADNTTGVLMSDGNMCPTYNWLVPILTGLYLLFGNVLLLNLLIAIFSNVFNEVEKNSIQIWKYGMYFLVVEYDKKPGLAPPLIFFEHLVLIWKWCIKNTCCNNNTQETQMSEKDESLNQIFEKEMVRQVIQKQQIAKDDMDLRIRRIMHRVDEMAKVLEEERLLEMLHPEDEVTPGTPAPIQQQPALSSREGKARSPPRARGKKSQNKPLTWNVQESKQSTSKASDTLTTIDDDSSDGAAAASDTDNTHEPLPPVKDDEEQKMQEEKARLKEKLAEEEEYDRLNFHRDPPSKHYPDTYDTVERKRRSQQIQDMELTELEPQAEAPRDGWEERGGAAGGIRNIASTPLHAQPQPPPQQAMPILAPLATPPVAPPTYAPPTYAPPPPAPPADDGRLHALQERLDRLEEKTSGSLYNIEALLRNAVFQQRAAPQPRGPARPPATAFMPFPPERRY